MENKLKIKFDDKEYIKDGRSKNILGVLCWDIFKKSLFDVTSQDKGKYFVELPSKFALRPDFVLNKGSDREIIADTKYKNITSAKDIKQADMCQLYAYGMKYKEVSQLYLIYPKNEEFSLERYSYIKDSLHLDILFFDLQKGFEQSIGIENE